MYASTTYLCELLIHTSYDALRHHVGVYASKTDGHIVKAPHPKVFLKDYSGICVTDGYQVYHKLEKEQEDLRIAGCWVHARRRFDEAMNVLPKEQQKKSDAYLVMKQIQANYREEGKLKELSAN